MKDYPAILGFYDLSACIGKFMIAQNKLDGSNLRASWHKKKGWHKFGSRTRLLDRTDEILGPGIDLFLNKYSEALEKVFMDTREYKEKGEATAFFEYFGPSSFAGTHDLTEPKDVVLFDIFIYKDYFVEPKDFYKRFGHLHVTDLIYEGVLTRAFIDDVRNGSYPVVEGVICKGGHKRDYWMRKIKTLSYLERLKNTLPKAYEQELKEQSE